MTDAIDVTRKLAAYLLSDASEVPASVQALAAQAFVNIVGCAIGGIDEPATRIALAQADTFSGARRARVLGHRVRLDAPHAALVNGLASSIQTFDDTHLASVIHPTGPVAFAALALMEHRSLALSGAEFIGALALGIEAACRVGKVLAAPGSGLHVGVFTTGIAGAIGAAGICGRLLGLDLQRQTWAIGIAAAQAGGLRVSHATMSGGLIPALSARTGLAAALWAEAGFDCSERALEGRNGLYDAFAPGAHAQDTLAALGETFEMADLSFKPYPCGVVIHPAIDACLEIARERAAGTAIESVRLRVHPLALELTGLQHPRSALDTKVSLAHWCAAALVRRRAGNAEASDAAVHDAGIAALRHRVIATADGALAKDEAHASVQLGSGQVLERHVVHARGSRMRPLTDAELADKFTALVEPVLGSSATTILLRRCAQVRDLESGWLDAFFDLATLKSTSEREGR